MNASARIALDQVTFRYAGRADASIQGIDLDIHEGEFVLLTGRSGCGKTTVARLINGLAPPFSRRRAGRGGQNRGSGHARARDR